MSGSVSSVDAGTFVVLVKLETPFASTFHLIQFQGIVIHTSFQSKGFVQSSHKF